MIMNFFFFYDYREERQSKSSLGGNQTAALRVFSQAFICFVRVTGEDFHQPWVDPGSRTSFLQTGLTHSPSLSTNKQVEQ